MYTYATYANLPSASSIFEWFEQVLQVIQEKGILAFSCSSLDHPKGDGKFPFEEIPTQPPAGGKAVSTIPPTYRKPAERKDT